MYVVKKDKATLYKVLMQIQRQNENGTKSFLHLDLKDKKSETKRVDNFLLN